MKDKAKNFFDMATTLPFQEMKDERDEYSIPELIQVHNLIEGGNMYETRSYADGLMKMFPDFDLISFAVAYGYIFHSEPRKAIDIAIAVLPEVKRHYRLYSAIGVAEYQRGRIPEALVWWSRSIIAQCNVMDYQEEDPFLYIGHAASVIGEKLDAEVYFAMSDNIAGDTHRLSPEQVDVMMPLRNHWVKKPLKKLIKHLQVEYNIT